MHYKIIIFGAYATHSRSWIASSIPQGNKDDMSSNSGPGHHYVFYSKPFSIHRNFNHPAINIYFDRYAESGCANSWLSLGDWHGSQCSAMLFIVICHAWLMASNTRNASTSFQKTPVCISCATFSEQQRHIATPVVISGVVNDVKVIHLILPWGFIGAMALHNMGLG